MTTVFQFVAVTALGLVVTGLAHLWFGLFESENTAFFLAMAIIFTAAFICDRRTARRRREEQGSLPPHEL